MKTLIQDIYPGCVIQKDGITYCIRRISRRRKTVTAIDVDNDVTKEIDFTFDQLVNAEIPRNSDPAYDLEEINSADWEIALERYHLVRPLLMKSNRTKQDILVVAEMAEASSATIYRWIQLFSSTGRISVFLRKRRSDDGKARLGPELEALMAKIITEKLLTAQKLQPTKVYRELESSCRENGWMTPHLNTLRERIRRIAPITYAKHRRGKNAELAFQPIRGSIPGADTPYSLIQIDHTAVDVILVDSVHRVPLKRPWLTLAIDVASRIVAGYYIAFDSPGTLGTGICVANLILPKEPILAKFGIDTSWPCQGIPGVIHLDNAREFHGNTLKMACNEYGIELKYRKIKAPQYGAHIERLMGTFMSEVHALPGTTFSNPKLLGDYVPEKEAAMTLAEFEKWLLNLIRAYNHRPHSELGMAPIQKYLNGAYGDDDTPGVGISPVIQDAERLRIDFLPLERRSVQPYGIQLDNIFYYADILQRWIGASDPESMRKKRKFLIRRDPRDISYILFYDPELYRYFRIPFRNTSHPSISLWELRAVNKFLSDQGKKDLDEDEIFAAYAQMRNIADKAKVSTKKSKLVRMANERKHSMATHPTSMLTQGATANLETTSLPIISREILPFDEVE